MDTAYSFSAIYMTLVYWRGAPLVKVFTRGLLLLPLKEITRHLDPRRNTAGVHQSGLGGLRVENCEGSSTCA